MKQEESESLENAMAVKEISANGISIKTSDVVAMLDEGNIQEAESSLREGLSLNHEEARALLGRLEYQKGNVEAALRVFEGIDLQAAVQRFQAPVEKTSSRRSRSRSESLQQVSQHAASLVLEAIYLKSKSLQKLGRVTEAANECNSVLDAVEKIFPQGIPEVLLDNRLQDIVSKAVELLPELWKQAGMFEEAIAAYRRALLNHWNLDNECSAQIQKKFAAFLLYGGVEAGAPSLGAQIDGSYVPRNNLEEAILLFTILLRKSCLGVIKWDPEVLEHVTFALSLCSLTSVIATKIEEVIPGIFTRSEQWIDMALCYAGGGQNIVALNLLRKLLSKHENPNELLALLLGSKICSEDCLLASEGVSYARHAVAVAEGRSGHLKGIALHLLGLCLGKQAKVASSDFQRTQLQTEALKKLDEAISFEGNNPEMLFDLGTKYAELRNMHAALRCARGYIDATGGSVIKGWKLLALVLSAQQRFSEAEVVVDAALDESGKWDQGPLLRLKAKLKTAHSLAMHAIETYRLLLALVQAQRKTPGPVKSITQIEDERVNEFEVWQGLATLYSNLSHWKDAEICLEKARSLNYYSATTFHVEGIMHEARGQTQEALAAYSNGLLLDMDHVPCKVSLGALLWKTGSKALPVARSLLSDALKLEPTNRLAWYHLGLIHRDDGRVADASDCLQAANMLEELEPVESFS
ncbi:protein NPG1 [Nymphaea colorata]|nr:protein NPG1 [Nymphaea colorata]